jgi:hypothetical protein
MALDNDLSLLGLNEGRYVQKAVVYIALLA